MATEDNIAEIVERLERQQDDLVRAVALFGDISRAGYVAPSP
jgi:hypothetical protein